jgi:CubicO group peptidase (beta-lactamase class C family)
MSGALRPGLLRLPAALLLWLAACLWFSGLVQAAEPGDIENDLTITLPGRATRQASLKEAMSLPNIPSVSVVLIDQDGIAWARAYGQDATPDTLFQAASLSKFVAAIGAMRLVDGKRLALDEGVNAKLTSWNVPTNDLDRAHPVTLRGLLSMMAGIGVPGFLGYAVEAPLPTLVQILDGTPPANSPPVTVIAVPGSSYHYSGGGYEIVEALMDDVSKAPFTEIMDRLVLKPADMRHSTFAQPLPQALQPQAATGHFADGREISGGFHVFPEHAAAGLWSTPSDLANLLILVGRAWRGESPADAQGMVVMTNSDNGSILAEALIRRAAKIYGWPPFGALGD